MHCVVCIKYKKLFAVSLCALQLLLLLLLFSIKVLAKRIHWYWWFSDLGQHRVRSTLFSKEIFFPLFYFDAIAIWVHRIVCYIKKDLSVHAYCAVCYTALLCIYIHRCVCACVSELCMSMCAQCYQSIAIMLCALCAPKEAPVLYRNFLDVLLSMALLWYCCCFSPSFARLCAHNVSIYVHIQTCKLTHAHTHTSSLWQSNEMIYTANT